MTIDSFRASEGIPPCIYGSVSGIQWPRLTNSRSAEKVVWSFSRLLNVI